MAYNPHRKRRDPESSLLTVVFRDTLINYLNLDVDLLAQLVKLELITVGKKTMLGQCFTKMTDNLFKIFYCKSISLNSHVFCW